MGVITCMLIGLMHIYVAHGSELKKPIALSVLSQDLQSLEAAFPSADLWSESKIIKYDDDLQIGVNYDQRAAESTSGLTFLMVAGKVTLAKRKELQKGQYKMDEIREIRKLLFHNSWFYFESPSAEPLLNGHDYYIIDYVPIRGVNPKIPTIEYVSADKLESQLMEFAPRIRYESSLTGTNLIKTSFRMKNSIKLNVQYDQRNGQAVFSADFQALVMTDERNFVEKSVKLDKVSLFLYKQSSPELSQLGLIHGLRVAPAAAKPRHEVGNHLKIKRNILLKDMLETRPVEKKGLPSVVGMIKYDSGSIYSVNYVQNNQKKVLSLTGGFVANDGSSFQELCVAFPDGETDRQDLKWFGKSDVYSENPVFFSCPQDKSDIGQIVLQEDADYIELLVGQAGDEQPEETHVAKKNRYVEPYLEYVSYDKFLQTMAIVTDAMKIRCMKGYPRRSFRLFVNIFLNFDCSTGIAYFDALDLWLGPGKWASFVWENLPGVSYDSNTQSFEREGTVLGDFKVRQLNSALPGRVPLHMQYLTSQAKTNLAFELSSIEWDLKDIYPRMIKNFLPQWGVIHVDDYVLFYAEKSEERKDGEKVKTITIKCDVTQPESCTEKQCVEKGIIVYDGNTITMKNNQGEELAHVPNKVYWPNFYKLPVYNDMVSISDRVHYAKLPTFKRHMKYVVSELQKPCSDLKKKNPESDAKLTLRIQYFNKRTPAIIAYYDCALNYAFFVSDFKIIKFPSNYGASTAYRPGEESTIGLQGQPGRSGSSSPVPYFDNVNYNQKIGRTIPFLDSEDDQLRRKYSRYILQDLIYDPVANILNSKSTFMSEVYALRPLPTNAQVPSKGGNPLKIEVRNGPTVHVYYY